MPEPDMDASNGGAVGKRWQALMDAAAGRVQRVARDSLDEEHTDCARQILLTPLAWHRWEQELGTALRPVAKFSSRMLQIRTLRQAGITWVHQAAPFRYMRDHNVRGEARQRLVAGLHGPFAGYHRAMVGLHGTYLRSVCHGFCAEHLGESVLGDLLYRESMERYQALYTEYFRTFGIFTCSREGKAAALSREMLPLMKAQLAELRQALLVHPLRTDWLEREDTMRKPSGDTQKLRKLDFNLD
jgi:hypothetical protein